MIPLGVLVAMIVATTLAEERYETSIRGIVREYCVACHSTEKHEGELDLERFADIDSVKRGAATWQHVFEQVASGEMPPADAKQLPIERRRELTNWIRALLDEVALASAGDPGPVVLRRLSNHEYTYTLRDLTGVDTLDPAREFPVDGAAGEGFTNAGAALVMSPALLEKYLAAAKEVASHAVLLPSGVRFSPSDSPQDWTDEALENVRKFYARYSLAVEDERDVPGAGRVPSERAAIPLALYLEALQNERPRAGLSAKYLTKLEEVLTGKERSLLLDPLRAKFAARQLTPGDIERWQKVLWRFNTVGHIGRASGPKAWQEPVSPLRSSQEFRVALKGGDEVSIFLAAGDAGDGAHGDQVVWENPRLVGKGRPDVPLGNIPELVRHLETQRARLIADAEPCLAALAAGNNDAPAESLAIYREYLGLGQSQLEPLLPQKLEGTPDYAFIRGWRGERDLSVLANSSDTSVRIPGIMPAHSVATHPAPDRAAVLAWKSPNSHKLRITGSVQHAHPECGNGVTWTLEARRGAATETLGAGLAQGMNAINIGPIEDVRVAAGQAIALVIGPREGNHSCDLTTINLHITDGEKTWDLANDVSPNILAGNPHGPWHFLSQPISNETRVDLPPVVTEWRKSPSAELAAKVRAYFESNFPLTHPLLSSALKSFVPSEATTLVSSAPEILEFRIPAALTAGSEFVVTGKLADASDGSVQLQVRTDRPSTSLTDTQPDLPLIVADDSSTRQKWEAACAEFRDLFPSAVCYPRIVPIDEVVTLNLYYREDEPLRRLLLTDAEIQELERLWQELLFVSEAPLKQVAAYEQIYQFATQDRPELLKELASLREPFAIAAEQFQRQVAAAVSQQRAACLKIAEQAWRRPLTAHEVAELSKLAPRILLARVLTSPSFLYRAESVPATTGPVNDGELATRLSYFLWSSLPDAELRSAAESGQLRRDEVLRAQTRRLLRDAKVRRLATEFGCQYLHVRDVATLNEKSERHFPQFRDLRDDMQEEVTRFFIDLFQHNRDTTSLLTADHTFVNQPLARHYGLRLAGDAWQRVEGMRAIGRGGVLGFAATLSKQSGASRTSAILRGTWVSEVVLGDKLPNPPRGVPVLPEQPPEGLTERQLIERHSSDVRCAACHKRIDPYGFALEGFDAIGRARPADMRATLADGTPLDGLDGLRNYIMEQRREAFLHQFNRKLLGYALGRSVQLSDEPLLADLARVAEHRVGDVIETIVCSPQFRNIRGRDLASDR